MPKKPSKKATPLSTDATEILIAEYNYIARTADQANEDRSRVSSFYLIAVGSLFAVLAGARFMSEIFDLNTVDIIFTSLFFLLTLLGTSTILQLTRLRVAWFESILAMNQIKEFIIAKDQGLADAFKWRIATLPSFYKVNSVAFLQTMEVAFISGLNFSAGVFFLLKKFPNECISCNWIYAIACGMLVFILQIWNYKRQLDVEHKRLQSGMKS